MGRMSNDSTPQPSDPSASPHPVDSSRIVSSSAVIAAPAAAVFELIADPARQPEWDGNDNLTEGVNSHRVQGVGEVFSMRLTTGAVRENHVVEFEEGRLIAWQPAEEGKAPNGHLWRWELEPLPNGATQVTHTYDWTALHDDPRRERRARATTEESLAASITRLQQLAEQGPSAR